MSAAPPGSRSLHPFETGNEERSVLPHKGVTVKPAGHLDALELDRTKDMHTLFECTNDRDLSAIHRSNVVDAVFDFSVGPHVMVDSFALVEYPVPTLFDPLEVLLDGIRVRRRSALPLHIDDPPQSA